MEKDNVFSRKGGGEGKGPFPKFKKRGSLVSDAKEGRKKTPLLKN